MRKTARVFLFLLALLSVIAFFFLSADPQMDSVLESPGSRHWMGTDSLGRDLLVRVLKGNFYSWVVGLAAAFVAFALGSFAGFWAGWKKKAFDSFLMRLIELLDSIPSVVLVTLFVLLFREWAEASPRLRILALALGIGLTHWMSFARLTRVLVLQESQSAFMEGAVAVGAGPFRLFWHHLRPHLTPVLLQSFWAHLPSFFLFESLLSFLGFGLQAPETSLGLLLQEGWRTFSAAPHLLLAPGSVLFLTLFCFQVGISHELPRQEYA
jgi:oligopeptide transport system permease protein